MLPAERGRSGWGRQKEKPGLMSHGIRSTAAAAVVCLATCSAHAQPPDATQIEGKIEAPELFAGSGNTYARGMAAILTHLGSEISYDQAMGLSGVAFILQVDTAGPIHPEGWLDCAWWPNDAWGFRLGLPVLSLAARRDLQCARVDYGDDKPNPAGTYREKLAPFVEHCMACERPVLAETAHGFVATLVDEEEPPLLGLGTETGFHFGDDPDLLGDYAWVAANSEGTTHPVGLKKPNSWGLYDMYGNVWEWTQDRDHANYEDAPVDGSAWEAAGGRERIVRGGSWDDKPAFCRSAARPQFSPAPKPIRYGFRIACTPV